MDLREGLARGPETPRIQSNSQGRVFENLLILGSAPGERWMSPPGDIRAYDVLSGHLVWQFHTVPQPGEFGYETWPKDAYKYVGGVNSWGEFSVDEARGIVYVPTGSPTYDFYGADRHWRQSLRQLPARARCADGHAALAFPDGASRPLGLRQRRDARN